MSVEILRMDSLQITAQAEHGGPGKAIVEGVDLVLHPGEVLPNALPPLITEFGLRFCFAFLFIASLSFLGLGIQPPLADWGGMVRDNAQAINFGGMAPLIPAAAIAQLTIGVNLVVDWFLSIHSRAHGEGA